MATENVRSKRGTIMEGNSERGRAAAGGGPAGRPVSAQAVLSAAGAADAEAVARGLASAGFEVSAPFAGSMAIGADAAVFERVFGVRLAFGRGGMVRTADAAGGAGGEELPVQRLPPALRAGLERVLFTPPPDFGPASY
jgi:hypothetical protein